MGHLRLLCCKKNVDSIKFICRFAFKKCGFQRNFIPNGFLCNSRQSILQEGRSCICHFDSIGLHDHQHDT